MTAIDLLFLSPLFVCSLAVSIMVVSPRRLPPWLERFALWSAAGFGAFFIVGPIFGIVLMVTRSVPISMIAALIAMHFGGKFILKSDDAEQSRKAERARERHKTENARERERP